MLFSSYQFLGVFFPLTLLAGIAADRLGGARALVGVLVAASLIFYAAWDARLLALLLSSVIVNYGAARSIASAQTSGRERAASLLVGLTIAANLAALGWFKYVGFLADTLNRLAGSDLPVLVALLPLGISFFTFEQIGYLVDVRHGRSPETDPLRYTLFVVFFPRLVAGPILRLSELLPQIPRTGQKRIGTQDLAVGLTLFAIGLAKKTVFADGVSPYASSFFADAASGQPIEAFAAWGGVLAYTMQIYFDFSGYSDMACGAARCFGLAFPMNFDSPYKSRSIIEFWRRWHMSLSRFLRDYLYISLGGNRRGKVRRYVNLMLTMLLGGLWHGANWTFVAWGGLHGLYLIVNHAWHALGRRHPALARLGTSRSWALGAWVLTMLAVVLAWVFFRAPSFSTAWRVLGAMLGASGIGLPAGLIAALGPLRPLVEPWIAATDASGAHLIETWAWVFSLGVVAAWLPNSNELLADWRPVLGEIRPARWRWQPTARWAVAAAVVLCAGVLAVDRGGEFIYWQF